METEFKFHIPPERLKAVLAAMQRGATVRTRLQARYYDTADGALAAHGVVLRLRKEGRRWVQTAKAGGAGLLQRLEHNVDRASAAAGAVPPPQLALHDGTPVGARLRQALAGTPGAVLQPTYGTDIQRLTRTVRCEGAAVELALDLGRIEAHGADGGAPRVARVCELELELLRGPLAGLVVLAGRWVQTHGLWLGTVSKAERGERLQRGLAQVPAVKAAAPSYGAQAPDGAAILQGAVAACLAQILPNAGELAEGSEDEEQIHQLRIGIRRLRTALRELAPLAPGAFEAADWAPPLVAAFRALGATRDRALLLGLLQPRLAQAGAPPIALPPAPRVPGPEATVRDAALQAALVAVVGLAEGAPAPAAGSLSPSEARQWLRRRLARLHRRTLRDGEAFPTLAPQEQHRVRKRLKRLRYLAEFAAPLFDAPRAADYLACLRPAQDALGEFNDEQQALAAYREATAHDPRAWFAVGWLQARQAAHARACRRALRALEDAPRFWRKR